MKVILSGNFIALSTYVKENWRDWAMVSHAFNPSTWRAEAGKYLNLRTAGSTEREFKDSQSYTEKPCHKKKSEERGGEEGRGRKVGEEGKKGKGRGSLMGTINIKNYK